MTINQNNQVALTLKVQNGLLKQYLVATGKTAAQFCRDIGYPYQTFVGYLNLTRSPISAKYSRESNDATSRENQLFNGSAIILANALGVTPEEIFPEELWAPLKQNKVTTYTEVKRLQSLSNYAVANTPCGKMIEGDYARLITSAIKTLPERERKVLEYRFGFVDGHTHTLEEVGHAMGVTGVRIGSLEAKAIRRLRHPSRAHIVNEARENLSELTRDRHYAKAV